VRSDIERTIKPLELNLLDSHAPLQATPEAAFSLQEHADAAIMATVRCMDAFVKATATTPRTTTTAAVTPTSSDHDGLQRTCSWHVQHYEVTVAPCDTPTDIDSSAFIAATSTKRLSCDHHMFQTLAVDRRGDVPHSNMTTLELEQLVDKQNHYVFQAGKGITAVYQHEAHPNKSLAAATAASDYQHKIRHFSRTDTTPATLKYQTISGSWDQRVRGEDGSNILGGSGVLSVYTNQTKIVVPVMTATEEYLSYYGAHLLTDGDVFQFQTTSEAEFPIFTMYIGVHYVQEYIIKKGMGLYLER
jgi:hypothetical protein